MKGSPYSGAALRRSTWHFLSGKATSAVLTLVILLWLVRLMPVVEYGVYVTLVAAMELIIAIAGLGLPWLASRYLPDFRLHASGRRLANLVARLVIWHAGALALFTGLAWLFLSRYLDWAGLAVHGDVARLYLLVLLLEGIGRNAREPLLGLLMQQGIARASLVLRLLLFLVLLAVLALGDSVRLVDVVRVELAASALGTVVALIGLARHVSALRMKIGDPDWREPRLLEMWRLAGNMYAAYMLTLLYSPQVFTLFIQRFLGVEATAVFGFMRNLYQQLARNLPAQLMFSIVRPKLVASFVGGGGIGELARNANLVGKLSLFVIMPMAALTGVASEAIIMELSGGKFAHTGLLFFGFMLTLIPFSQRQLLETVAVASGHSKLCTHAAASGVLMLPLMFILMTAGLALWAPVIALWLGQSLFNAIILIGLRRRADYSPDNIGFYKLMLAAAAGYLSSAWLPLYLHETRIELLWQLVLTGTTYFLVAWLLKPFTVDERKRMNTLFKRRIFIW